MEGSIERWSLGPELELDSRTRTARRFRSWARTSAHRPFRHRAATTLL